MQVIIDERADAGQRDALLKILTGQETDDMATMWWVYAARLSNARAHAREGASVNLSNRRSRRDLIAACRLGSPRYQMRACTRAREHR